MSARTTARQEPNTSNRRRRRFQLSSSPSRMAPCARTWAQGGTAAEQVSGHPCALVKRPARRPQTRGTQVGQWLPICRSAAGSGKRWRGPPPVRGPLGQSSGSCRRPGAPAWGHGRCPWGVAGQGGGAGHRSSAAVCGAFAQELAVSDRRRGRLGAEQCNRSARALNGTAGLCPENGRWPGRRPHRREK